MDGFYLLYVCPFTSTLHMHSDTPLHVAIHDTFFTLKLLSTTHITIGGGVTVTESVHRRPACHSSF